MNAHVSDTKKKEVELIKTLLKKYKNTGIVDLTNLPSKQLQQIRARLKDFMLIRITKKRLIKKALEQLKDENLNKLVPYIDKSMPALLFTDEDPFKLFKKIKSSKSAAPAKPGQIAPKDLIIEPGPTSFPPGPIIGELGQAGIVAAVENGKVTIKRATTLAKEGEPIKPKVADVLAKLGIEPMEIGLNVTTILKEDLIYERKVLDVDEEAYIKKLKLAHSQALNLAIKIGYITKDTIKSLINKGFTEAKAIAEKYNINIEEVPKDKPISKETVEKNLKKSDFEDREKAKEVLQKMQDEGAKDLKKEEKPKEDNVPKIQDLTNKKSEGG
ncbi:50S ribosomal protein L10 [archaeon]|nr:50S ribosomal protein L10 [archaeon]